MQNLKPEQTWLLSDEYYNNTEATDPIIIRGYTVTLKVIDKKTGKGLADIPIHITKGTQDVALTHTNHHGNLYNLELYAGHYDKEHGDNLQNDVVFKIVVNEEGHRGYRPSFKPYVWQFLLREKQNIVIALERLK